MNSEYGMEMKTFSIIFIQRRLCNFWLLLNSDLFIFFEKRIKGVNILL